MEINKQGLDDDLKSSLREALCGRRYQQFWGITNARCSRGRKWGSRTSLWMGGKKIGSFSTCACV